VFTRRLLPALLSLMTALSACAPAAEKAPEPFRAPQVGDKAPEIQVWTIGGNGAHVGGAERQPVTLVNVWATWCGPCKAEFPELQELHTTYGARGLRVLAVSIDTDDDAEVAKSARSMGATFTIGRDPEDIVRGKMAAYGIPESWLVSADGTLLWRHSGAIPAGDPTVRAAIDSALNSSAGTR
jgi:cytochrome c biogenesis protein CcmG, thiol:disulfide interchange protein DsbE